MKKGMPVSERLADEYLKEGITSLFDLRSSACSGYFPSKTGFRASEVLVVTDEGYFIRAREDLKVSRDGVFVCFEEDGIPPEFEDVFTVTDK